MRNDLSDGAITERSATRVHDGSDAKSHITRSMATMKTAQPQEDDYDSQSESDAPIIPHKWKAATDHKNSAFEESLRNRTIAKSSNYLHENK